MMGRDGGTIMYCPACEVTRVCRAISPTELGYSSSRTWHMSGNDDVQWFRRGRQCLHCGESFVTSEVREAFLEELVELRSALVDLKQHAEEYVQASGQARDALEELTDSLEVLRALKLYKAT